MTQNEEYFNRVYRETVGETTEAATLQWLCFIARMLVQLVDRKTPPPEAPQTQQF